MKNMIYLMLAAIVLLAACTIPPTPADKQPTDGSDGGRLAAIECPPELQDAEFCTEEYAPVCADGVTYSNRCFACKEPAVDRYFEGACEDLGRDTILPPSPGSVVHNVTEEILTPCTGPRPEICTKEYNPVCGQRDNGIRCITQPCPSEDLVTYGNACEACADPNVYGYTPGACEQDVDNNPADDAPDASCAAVTCPTGQACVDGRCIERNGNRPMYVCDERSPMNDPQTCVDECPAGYDVYGSQLGPACIRHYGEQDILSWPVCNDQDQCMPEQACVKATRTTDNQEIATPQFRCAPSDYFDFLLHTSGAEYKDENGETLVVIA